MSENIVNLMEEALNCFWNGFGIPSFRENNIPRGIRKPYLVYTLSIPKTFNTSQESATIYSSIDDHEKISHVISGIIKALPDEGVLLVLNKNHGFVRLSRRCPFVSSKTNADNLIRITSFAFGQTCISNE